MATLTQELTERIQAAKTETAAVRNHPDLSSDAKQRKSNEILAAARANAEGLVRSRVQAAEKKYTAAVEEMRKHEEDHEARINFPRLAVAISEVTAKMRAVELGGLETEVNYILENGDYYQTRALISALPAIQERAAAHTDLTKRSFGAGLDKRIDERLRALEPVSLQLDRKDADEAYTALNTLRNDVRGFASIDAPSLMPGNWDGLMEAAGFKRQGLFN